MYFNQNRKTEPGWTVLLIAVLVIAVCIVLR